MQKFLFPAVLAVLLAVGCAKKSPLIGTWTTTRNGTTMNMTFNDGGSFTGTADLAMPGTAPAKLTFSGDWTMAEKKLTIVGKDVKIDGLDKRIEAMAKPQIEKSMKESQTSDVEFKGDNEMTITFQGVPTTFTRK